MSSKLYKAIFFIIGVITLGFMVNRLGVNDIWINIKKTGYWFFPVIAIWLAIYILNAFAFKAIIQEPSLPNSYIPFSTILRVTISGYAINYITPFVALGGEPYRVMELKKYLGTNKATSSVLLYGLMHMFSHIIFWLLSIVLIVCYLPLDNSMLTGCIIAFAVGVLMTYWFLRVYKKGVTISTFKLFQRIPFIRRWAKPFAAAKANSLHEIDEQVRILYANRKPAFYKSLVLEIAGRVVTCLEIWFIALAIGLPMSFFDSLIVSSASSLFANLIFFMPMQLGAREGGLALALKSVGLPAAPGIFVGIITRIRELVWIIIGLVLVRAFKTKDDSGSGRIMNDE